MTTYCFNVNKIVRVQMDPDPAGSLINWPLGSTTLPAILYWMMSCDDGTSLTLRQNFLRLKHLQSVNSVSDPDSLVLDPDPAF